MAALKYDAVYAYWKAKIEDDGVLVYESQYIPDESCVIGAAIYYAYCPIILVKRGGSANQRKLFTLLHEYAHLLLERSAVNDAHAQVVTRPTTEESKLEARCNKYAAEILIPADEVNKNEYNNLNPVQQMELLAQEFKVTFSTAAVCLKRLNLISQTDLSRLLDLRRAVYREQQKKRSKRGAARIPRENLMRLDMGRPMFNVVISAYGMGALDVYDASSILNLRVNKIDKLAVGTT